MIFVKSLRDPWHDSILTQHLIPGFTSVRHPHHREPGCMECPAISQRVRLLKKCCDRGNRSTWLHLRRLQDTVCRFFLSAPPDKSPSETSLETIHVYKKYRSNVQSKNL